MFAEIHTFDLAHRDGPTAAIASRFLTADDLTRDQVLKRGAGDPEANDIPVEETTVVRREGDLWLLGRHRVLCGNAVDQASYAALMDQEEAIGIFTDPPFNVPIQGHVCGKGSIQHPEFIMASGEMSPEAFRIFLQNFLCRTAQVTADGGILYACIDWRHVRDLLEAAEAAGLGLLNLCVWVKDNAGMGSFYRSQHELVVVLKKGQTSHINNIQLGKFGRNRSNVWHYPELRKRFLTLQNRYGAKLVIVEEAGTGKSLLQDIRSQGMTWFKGLKPTQDKITRLAQQSAKIESGMVFLPNNAPWLEAFEKELIAFPNGKHDDQVDSLSQFLRGLDFRPIEILPLKLYESDRWLWAQNKEDQTLSSK